MSDEYPEHEKLSLVQEQSQGIYDFLEWLGTEKLFVAQHDIPSDECRNCDHDEPHRAEVAGGSYICEAEWCECDWNDRGSAERIYRTPRTAEAMLAEFFGIDLKVLEAEKQALLAALRELPKVKAAEQETECTG